MVLLPDEVHVLWVLPILIEYSNKWLNVYNAFAVIWWNLYSHVFDRQAISRPPDTFSSGERITKWTGTIVNYSKNKLCVLNRSWITSQNNASSSTQNRLKYISNFSRNFKMEYFKLRRYFRVDSLISSKHILDGKLPVYLCAIRYMCINLERFVRSQKSLLRLAFKTRVLQK